MESYSFKSVAFGGFDKQDVVRYLEQSSEKAAAAQRERDFTARSLSDADWVRKSVSFLPEITTGKSL